MDHPDDFLNIVFHEKDDKVGDNLALCAGFERGEWRNTQLAKHVMEWLPEFALTHSELEEIGHHNAVSMIEKAARLIYQTEKYGSRGEFGEILLHIAIRQVYETIPAVSKIYYKSAVNKTVEGFDAVHVVRKDNGLELWIGETKFYDDLSRAIREVSVEIVDHLETDYLKNEFLLITNKIDSSWVEADKLKALLAKNVSLDDIFQRVCIPVLLTYDSPVVEKSEKTDDDYRNGIADEVKKAYSKMRETLNQKYASRFGGKVPITVHVILIPLKAKKEFVASLDGQLKKWQ